jgi:hypothetical protein
MAIFLLTRVASCSTTYPTYMEKQITPKNPTYEEKKYAGHVNPSYMQ